MSATDLKNRIASLVSHILFEYEGLPCGIDPINAGCIDLWCGEDSVRCKSVEEAMTGPALWREVLKRHLSNNGF